MFHFRPLITAALFAALAHASDYYAYLGTGPGNTTDRAPNGNTSTDFALWYTSYPISANRSPRWTWNINVTEIEAPEGTTNLTNAAQVQTTYGFEWHINGTDFPTDVEGQLVAGEQQTDGAPTNSSEFCMTVVQSYFPANITNAYNSNGIGSVSCGDSFLPCANGIIRAYFDADADEETGCYGNNVDLSDVDECKTVFPTYEAETYNLANMSLTNGSTFFHRGSAPYSGHNQTVLDAELQRMHMLIYNSGGAWDVMCARVDNTTVRATDPGVEQGAASACGVNAWLAALVVLGVGFSML